MDVKFFPKALFVLLIVFSNIVSACTPPPKTPIPGSSGYGYVSATEAIVREAASTDSPEVGRLPFRTVVTVIIRQGEWVQIETPKISTGTGWVLATFLDFTESPPTPSTAAASPTPTLLTELTPTPTPTPMNSVLPTTVVPTPTPSNTHTPIPASPTPTLLTELTPTPTSMATMTIVPTPTPTLLTESTPTPTPTPHPSVTREPTSTS